jgi:branched-chain amino acid transport system permease protein
MLTAEIIIQQLIIGLSNGLIIALIALGYTMVYGILELINFAHGDLFMLGSYGCLTLVGLSGLTPESSLPLCLVMLVGCALIVGLCCGGINCLINRYAYRPLRHAPRLAPLVSAIGVSFILINIGLFWGGMPMEVFSYGRSAASPKDFPALLPFDNLLGDSFILITLREVAIVVVTIPLMLALTYWVTKTKTGKAMRALAEDRSTAQLMGIAVEKITTQTFFVGGFLAGIASLMYCLYNNTVFFQMGFRVGIDAFSAAVLGGIGSLTGAVLGGIVIGVLRSMSDQFIATEWTNAVVFSLLMVTLIFRPQGLLGRKIHDKV